MGKVQWAWDPRKALANQQKHGVSFELAVRVFEDPLHLSIEDPHDEELRWRSLGQVAGVTLIVVHTVPAFDAIDSVERGRIISARKATRRERMACENG
jgi:uncharacterized protein